MLYQYHVNEGSEKEKNYKMLLPVVFHLHYFRGYYLLGKVTHLMYD